METAPRPGSLRLLIGLASFVVIVAAFHTAGTLLIPFLLSVFFAIICTPVLFWLQRRRVPNVLAIILGADPTTAELVAVTEDNTSASDERST